MSRRSVTFVLLSLSLVVLACVWAGEAGAVTSAGLTRPGQSRPQVACGTGHTVAIATDGTLWATGANNNGQLGLSDTANRSTPTQVIINKTTYPSAVDNNWIAVAASGNFTLALQSNGTLWAWGDNAYGQLGLSDTAQRTSPTQVGIATTWVSVSCGYRSVDALQSNGTLWTWGNNTYGQLGLGSSDATVHSTPAQVSGTYTAVSCGLFHVLAVQSNGSLWSWGYNAYGQVGMGDTTQRNGPVQVGSATTWTAVACGAYHSAALQSNGYLYDWGYNTNYQLGDGTTGTYLLPRQVNSATDWTGVSCGWYDTMAQKANGSLWGWGSDLYGEQGDNASNTYQTTPKQVAVPTSVSAVFCGYYQTFSLTANGRLYAWGSNNYGQLGLGDTANRGTPTAVAQPNTSPADDAGWSAQASRVEPSGQANQSFVIKANGELLAWGFDNGGLGLGASSPTNRLLPAQVGLDPAVGANNVWTAVAAGGYCTLGLRADGTLWTCGDNVNVALGRTADSTHPAYLFGQVGSAATWVGVAAGRQINVALQSNGSLWAWGDNTHGEIGQGNNSLTYSTPTQVGSVYTYTAVACGWDFVAALRSDGTLWVWGDNAAGQLGLGDTTDRLAPTQVGAASDWAAIACEWSGPIVAIKSNGTLWQLTSSGPAQIGSAANWTAVACGVSHAAALQSNGTMWTWGSNNYGQLGICSSDTGAHPNPIQVGVNWLTVACGYQHTLATRADHTLFTWGWNVQGQLGDNSTTDENSPHPETQPSDVVSPVMTSLSSATHPNQSAWYVNNTPTLSWSATDSGLYGVEGYIYWTDHTATPTTVPTTTTFLSWVFGGITLPLLADGTWYFHIRPIDGAFNYGAVSTYTLNIDATGPTLGALSSTSHPNPAHWYANRSITCNWSPVSDPSPGIGGPVCYWYSLDQNATSNPTGSRIAYGTAAILTAPADGTWYFHVRAVDALGNAGPTQHFTVQIDTTGPTLGPLASYDHSNSTAWYINPIVSCYWSAVSDPAPGVGGTVTYWYALDQSATWSPSNAHSTTYTGATQVESGPDGVWYFHVCAVDALGNVGATQNFTVQIDTTAPILGAVSSTSHPSSSSWYANRSVTCSWPAATDPQPGAGTIDAYWYAFDQSPTTIPNGALHTSSLGAAVTATADGVWYFHVCAFDAAGNLSVTRHFAVQIETTPPANALVIGDGSGYANSHALTLTLASGGLAGPVQFQVRNAGDAWPSSWSAFSTSVPWAVPLFDGYKSVELRYQDGQGNITNPVSATVVLDTTPPSGWLAVADGAAAVNSTSTSVEYWANDVSGIDAMRLRNGGDSWPAWTPVIGGVAGGLQAWALPTTGDGPKNVCVQFKDAAGNITMIEKQVILDTTPPSGNMVIDGGIPATYDPSATLALSAHDANDPIDMRLRDATGTWGDWQPYDASMAWTLPGADGPKSVEVQYRDVAGNLSAAIPSSIYLDRVAPSTADNSAGVWHAAPFALQLTATDSGSGTSGGQAKTEYSTDGGFTWTTGLGLSYDRWKRGGGSGLYTVWVRSTDAAGNTETAHPLTVMIDTGAPTCSCDAPTGTVAGPLTVTFSGHDALSGSAETWYSLDGGTWTRAAAVTVSDAGTHTLRYYAVDSAGNAQVGYSVCSFTLTSGGSGVARRLVVRPRVMR